MSDSDSSSAKSKKGRKKEAKRVRENSTSDESIIDKNPVKKGRTNGGSFKNADGDEMFELGKMRFVTVRSFKGKSLIDIREYYQDKGSGELKPGRKGISLSGEQYQRLKAIMSDIDEKLSSA
ncbi:RNA polymerase II transcriptional coactivator, putative [Brugia malayi]|uniref:Bm5768 n=2 Tax=Brugia TaxID=6278 RepID=A0A0K0JKA0_BRUMA|nr:RNA polymerase II transcriptional coactivator, putative [Brugia malayi]CRZ22822.1 Bm5768 [Brugia malayi]VIO89808.1 RNA polymerase II transcriptional coactivator, putative [Brugia malayi]